MSNMLFSITDIKFSEDNTHVNKMPFSGVCLLSNTPSDGTPCGADKPVQFTEDACRKAIDTFAGMGVDCVYDDGLFAFPEEALTGHNARFKIGVVESAEVQEDGKVFIKGNLWKHDFGDVCFMIQNAKDALGFSVEVMVTDMDETEEYYSVNDFCFTGVAILYKNLAAFKNTQLAAQRKKQKEIDNTMNEEQFKQFMDAMAGITASVKNLNDKIDSIQQVDFSTVTEAIGKLGEKIEAQAVKPAEPAPMQASAQPEPKTEGTFVGKGEEPKKIDFNSIREEVMNDASIPYEQKHRMMFQKWYEAQKA